MDFQAVELYLTRLPYNEPYFDLELPFREKLVFSASEMLSRRYGDDAVISDNVIALQSLYIAEGEGQDFAMFKRQGVKSMGMDGMSFSFEGTNVSPEVIAILGPVPDKTQTATKGRASWGRLR